MGREVAALWNARAPNVNSRIGPANSARRSSTSPTAKRKQLREDVAWSTTKSGSTSTPTCS